MRHMARYANHSDTTTLRCFEIATVMVMVKTMVMVVMLVMLEMNIPLNFENKTRSLSTIFFFLEAEMIETFRHRLANKN